jgi:hypothetical protein
VWPGHIQRDAYLLSSSGGNVEDLNAVADTARECVGEGVAHADPARPISRWSFTDGDAGVAHGARTTADARIETPARVQLTTLDLASGPARVP